MTSKSVYQYRVWSFSRCTRLTHASKPSLREWLRLWVLLLFSFCYVNMNAQEYRRTFTREINTPDKLTVATNVPSSLSIQINGANADGSNTKYGYIIKGNNSKDRLYVNKDYVIETWDKNIVRQEVDVLVKAKNHEIAHNLLDQLEINMPLTAEGHITIDANMNFMQFEMTAKRFRSEVCTVTLNDGSVHNVEYLEIKSRLFIPRKSNLKVSSILHHTLHLGDLEGDLDLNLQYGEVYGKKINNLKANLRFCFNVIFEEANNVAASATNSHLKITKVNQLRIGEIRLGKGELVHGHQIQWLDNNSSMNLYNFRNASKIIVHDSANDDFTIGEVSELEVKSAIYSKYKVLRLNNLMDFSGKSCDLSIAEVDRNFESIDVQNKLGKLNFNIANDGNYSINLFEHQRLEIKMPSTARLLAVEGVPHLQYKMGKKKPTADINITCDRCELDVWD